MVFIPIVVLVIIALLMIFLPVGFTGEPRRLRLSALGLILYIIQLVLSCLPDKIQHVIIRGTGILCLGISIWLTLMVLDVTPKSEVESVISHGKGASSSVSWKYSQPDDNKMDSDYIQRILSEGPAYTEKVRQIVSRQRSDWIIESPEPMVILITDRESYLQAQYVFRWALHNETPPEERASIILKNSPSMFETEKIQLKESGQLVGELNRRRKQYEQPTINSSTPTSVVAPGEGREIDHLLQQASARWRANDIDGALLFAQDALKIAEKTLGPNHPKTAEIANMVNTAYSQLAEKN